MVEGEKARRLQTEAALEELRKEYGVLRGECAALRGRLGREEREKEKDKEGGGEAMRRELEEERTARILAERKLMDAMEKLRAASFYFFTFYFLV